MKVLKIKQLLLVFKASKGLFDGHVNIYHMKGIFLYQSNFLKGSYDAISSFPFSLECSKLIVHR